jgi:putative phage-type endonuclease
MVNTKTYNLDSDVEFLEYSSEEDWHDLRKGGIGGSDVGAIMGLNKYVSPLKLYRIKKGIYAEDTEDNVYIKKGKDLEKFIFENHVTKYFENIGYRTVHPEHVFVNKQHPWLRANCDGLAIKNEACPKPEDNIVIEIKWVSEWAEVNWNGDEYCGVPASYYAQVQHYMTVTGARVAILFALFDKDWQVRCYNIPYDRSFALKMLRKSNEFWTMLQTGTEPAITPTLDKSFMPAALEEMPKKTEVSEELDSYIVAYLSAKEDLKKLEKELDEYYNKAVAAYLEGKRPTDKFKMSISSCKKSGFDSKKFAEDHPEIYERYKTVTEYTRTTMNWR